MPVFTTHHERLHRQSGPSSHLLERLHDFRVVCPPERSEVQAVDDGGPDELGYCLL